MEPRWITGARKYLGLHEGTDLKANPQVLKFFKEAGHPEIRNDHTVPWCAAFVGAILTECGIKPTGTLWALDYARWGIPLKGPVVGAIGTKKRLGGGHVFFVVGYDHQFLWVLGGNQDDQVCVEKIHRTEVYSLRWPTMEELPKDYPPAVPYVAAAKSGASEA